MEPFHSSRTVQPSASSICQGSGTFVLNGATSSFEALSSTAIFNGMGYNNTLNKYVIANWNSTANNQKDLVLPDKSGSFFLQADSSLNYEFTTVNEKSLFHDTLGIGSDSQRIVTYWGDTAI